MVWKSDHPKPIADELLDSCQENAKIGELDQVGIAAHLIETLDIQAFGGSRQRDDDNAAKSFITSDLAQKNVSLGECFNFYSPGRGCCGWFWRGRGRLGRMSGLFVSGAVEPAAAGSISGTQRQQN